MKYLRLFENFETNEDAQATLLNPSNQGAAPKTYVYHIHKDAKGEDFHASVRDQDGKVIFEINGDAMFNQDGEMKDKDDVGGLNKLLVAKNKIRPGDSVVPSGKFEGAKPQAITSFNSNPVA